MYYAHTIIYTLHVHYASAVNDTLRCLDVSWNKLQVAGTTAVLQAIEVGRVARYRAKVKAIFNDTQQ